MQSFVWGASNTTLKGYNAIAVATKNTNLEADNTLALAAKDSTVSASDSVVLGGERITINPAGEASLAVWSKINVLGASGALVFNGKPSLLPVDSASAHTMVVNADNGLIINTNNSNNQKIQLTVSGAIKLWEVNNAPAQASPYISVKTKGSVTCVCGRVSNQNSALSKYTRGNKQIADLCQKVCDDQNTTLTAQCGAAATNYPLTQTQWSTDDFCQWGLGHAGAKPTFPTLGGQVSWTCESFPSGGPTCTATRKGCWDGIRAAGEQCDLGTNNGKPDSNCSTSCENVKAPKCWANAKTYLGSDVAWAQPNGFCTDDSVLGEATPAFWNGSTSWQKTWTCKNKNNKTLTCSANRLPPAVAGACGSTLNTCSAGTLWAQTNIDHGKRWSCDGLYGGSNKSCSICDSGYKYNTTTNICEVDCPNPIYRHTNGVTIKAAACAESGKEYMFEGQKYYVARDKDDIKEKIATNAYPANRIVTTRVTDMQELFKDNTTFNQPIGSWDTSNVTTMATMFSNARNFNQDIRYWDTSKVTAMSNIFNDARAFNQPLNSRDVSKVHNSYQMFLRAESFNQPLNNWDTRNFTDLYWMFEGAKAFNQNINNWNINNVTDLRYVFAQASAFNQPLDNWNINAFADNKLQGMLNSTPLFQAQQPYCTWTNWSAKKWNFVSMGLNACTNGQCKAYPWNHASQPATSTANGCVGGDYQDIADDANNWKWKCNGKYGATSTECSASKQPAPVNAQCKVYPWNHASQPATATANGCVAGDYQDIPDDANNWKWKCIGKYLGTSTECSASKQLTCPSGFTTSNGKCVQWKCINPSTKTAMCMPKRGASTSQTTICLTSSKKNTCIKNSFCEWQEMSTSPLEAGRCKDASTSSTPSSPSQWTKQYECQIKPSYIWRTLWIGKHGEKLTKNCSQYDAIECERQEECFYGEASWSQSWGPGRSSGLGLPWLMSLCDVNMTKEQCQKDLNCEWEPDTAASVKKVAKCIDSEWNEMDDNECKNAGAKPNNCNPTPQITCPAWFSIYNWKCVQWKCEEPESWSCMALTKALCQSENSLLWGDLNLGSPRLWCRQVVLQHWYIRPDWKQCSYCAGLVYPKSWGSPKAQIGWVLTPIHIERDVLVWPNAFDCTKNKDKNSCMNYANCYWWKTLSLASLGLEEWELVCMGTWGKLLDKDCDPAKKAEVSCGSSQQINGQCKIHAWNHTSQPATATANGCLAGEYEDVADDSSNWKWKCKGKNWGAPAECSASKQTSACPTWFSMYNGKCVQWRCETTPWTPTPWQCSWFYNRPIATYRWKDAYPRCMPFGFIKKNPLEEESESSDGITPLPDKCCSKNIDSMLCPDGPGVWKFFDYTANNPDYYLCLIDADKNPTCRYSCARGYNAKYCTRVENIEKTSCSWLNQTECNAKKCTRTPWISSQVKKNICRDKDNNILPDNQCAGAEETGQCWVNGQCKTYPWSHASQPATATANGCTAGDYQDISDDATSWKWKCKGRNWGTEDICSSIKEAYTPEIRLEEISHWSEYCWGNRYVHVTIKNPKWRSMKIEHSHTISSISNWGKVDMRWKEYSRKLQKQTSDQQYEFDLQKIPSSPICDWSVEGEFSVYVTVDWKETVMTHSYLNITKDKPYAACCLVEDPLKSGLWGI